MKKILYIAAVLVLSYSCELDNYGAPDASLSGNIIDAETGELVQTDIIEGTTIKIIEHGYDPVAPQYLRVKNDGTYANTMLFSNTYTVQPDVRNFVQIDAQEVKIGKNTKLDFQVTPYLRIKNVEFTTEGNSIIASFQLEQTTSDAVHKIALFASDQPIVGDAVRSVASERVLNRAVGGDEVFRLGINAATTNYLKTGQKYYFRVGAVSGFPGARYNYASAEKITIGELVEEQEPPAQVMDRCETTEGWGGSNPISLDSVDPQEGSFSVKADVQAGGVVIFQKIYAQPFDTGVSKENGYLAFSLYVSDISQINWEMAGPSIEITSAGTPDNQELSWDFNKSLRLQNGWNQVKLKLSGANVVGGNIDLSAVNFIRIFHLDIRGPLEMKIDNIRFFEEF